MRCPQYHAAVQHKQGPPPSRGTKRPYARAKHWPGWGEGVYSAGLPIITLYFHNVQRKNRDLKNTIEQYKNNNI